jgi:hypothetical protein
MGYQVKIEPAKPKDGPPPPMPWKARKTMSCTSRGVSGRAQSAFIRITWIMVLAKAHAKDETRKMPSANSKTAFRPKMSDLLDISNPTSLASTRRLTIVHTAE